MQCRLGARRIDELGASDVGVRPRLVDSDARFEQRFARRRVPTVHRELVVRGQRIGDDGYLDAPLLQVREVLNATLHGHEIGRNDREFALGRVQGFDQRRYYRVRFFRFRLDTLVRRIDNQLVGRPFEEVLVGLDVFEVSRTNSFSVFRATDIIKRRGKAVTQFLQRGVRIVQLPGKGRHRQCRLVIPVHVEHIGHVLHDRSDADDVQVAELGVFSHAEVFVSDVAPADDRNLVIDREGLVVHAAIYPSETGQGALESPGRATVEGVEYAYLEVRVRVERGDADVVTGREHVIQQ